MTVILKSSTRLVTGFGELIMVVQVLMKVDLSLPIKMGMYFCQEPLAQIQVLLPRDPINPIDIIPAQMHFLQNLIVTVYVNGVPIMEVN